MFWLWLCILLAGIAILLIDAVICIILSWCGDLEKRVRKLEERMEKND